MEMWHERLRPNHGISLPVWTSALSGIWRFVPKTRVAATWPFWYQRGCAVQGPRRSQRSDAQMINLCDNWLRIERIELTVFADNPRHCGVQKTRF
jgi:putative acetyltransferase